MARIRAFLMVTGALVALLLPATSFGADRSAPRLVRLTRRQIDEREQRAHVARQHFFRGEYLEAANLFRELSLEFSVSQPLYLCELGTCHLVAGEHELAIESLTRAAEMNEGFFDARSERAAAGLFGSEKKKLFKGDPYERATLGLFLGLLFLQKNDVDNALACFKNGILCDSDVRSELYKSDFALLQALEAKCYKLRGQESMYEQSARQAAESFALTSPSLVPLVAAKQGELKYGRRTTGRGSRGPVKGSVGINYRMADDGGSAVVRYVYPDSPADKDGRIRPGDRVIAVTREGKGPLVVADASLHEVSDAIGGMIGTAVTLAVVSRDAGANARPVDIVLQRGRHVRDIEYEIRAEKALVSPRYIDPLIAADYNTLILVWSGVAPTKHRTGKHGEKAVFVLHAPRENRYEIRVDRLPATDAIQGVCETAFQATTRGGRRMDNVLRTQAEFKSISDGVGDVLLDSFDDVGGTAGLVMLGVGLLAKGVSAAANPAADVRQWRTLPHALHAIPMKLRPGRHECVVEEYADFLKIGERRLVFRVPEGAVVQTVWVMGDAR
ncbi:MAG: PDZ domain-containing protein [Lentisphaerae bacterium]|nr:PDZ domain-containing protein [Lentisphaerota bacterium]